MMQASSESTPLKLRIVRQSTLVSTKDKHKHNYLINVDDLTPLHGGQFRIYEFGKASDGINPFNKVILVVGATGAGKTTLINSLINYAFGVEYDDNFRLKLITEDSNRPQAESQTQSVNTYKIHLQEGSKIPYTLTIIDTPGFGDTRGIGKDKEITGQLHDFFTSHFDIVDHIDAVAFVAQASLARLTVSQKYIFDAILSLFGKDIGENIFIILTFCDSAPPEILPAIEAAEIPYQEYFKFNLSVVFADSDDDNITGHDGNDESDGGDDFNRVVWKVGMKSFNKFIDAIEGIPSRDLRLTQGVLERRRKIDIYVGVMNRLLQECLFKLRQLKQEEAVLKKHETNMNANESFTFEVEETGYSDKDTYWSLFAIIWAGVEFFVSNFMEVKLPVLPAICDVKPTTVKKTKTLASIKERYDTAKDKCMTVQQVIDAIREDIEMLQDQIMFAVCEIRESLSILRQIALKHNPLSTVDYIEMLIENKRTEAMPGWQGHVDELMKIRECYTHLAKLEKDDVDPFKEFSRLFRDAVGSTPGDFFKTGSSQYSDYKRAKKDFLEKIDAVSECTTQ